MRLETPHLPCFRHSVVIFTMFFSVVPHLLEKVRYFSSRVVVITGDKKKPSFLALTNVKQGQCCRQLILK